MNDDLYRDQPTGLYNRRYLDEALPESIHAWIQAGEAFTLVMVDLDHFKTVNDQYGHARGDAVLKSFARFLQESTRTTDHVIRYGGDEFLCILPNMQRMNAELLYNRILEKCHASDFDGLKMTISVGLASFPIDGMDYQQLFAMADASLYNAKRGGRNRLGAVQKKQIDIPIKAFIGRRDELSTLLNKITNDEDRLRVILINGNVGVGKSRLTRECLNLTRGYEVIWADCLLFSETIAYYAIRELVKYRMQRRGPTVFDELPLVYRLEIGKLVPEVLEAIRDKVNNLDLVVDRYRLYEGVRKSIEMGEQAKVVVIDNIQWIDKESLETLRYLFRSMKDTSNVFILLNRVEEVPGQVLDFLADVSREVPIDEIELAPLPASQIRECVRAIIGDEPEDRLTEYAFQSSGGNPYFLEELFRGLAAGNYLTLENDQWQFRVPAVEIVPKSIEQIAQRKYKLLSVEAQAVTRFASIIGKFDLGMLRHLAGYGESELRGLLAYISRSGIMRELQGKLVFVDEFSRRAIYRKFVTGPDAPELHRQVAERLEMDHGGREVEVLDELASNYYYAGDKAKGLEYCLLAGQRAQEKYANEDAIRYYSWAEELLEGEKDVDAKRYALLLARTKVYDLQGLREAQHKDLLSLQKLADALGNSQRLAEMSLLWAEFADATSDYPAVIASAQEAIRLAQDIQDASIEAGGYLLWGGACWMLGEFQTARVQLEQAINLAQVTGQRQIVEQSFNNLGITFAIQGDHVKASLYFEQALKICRELGDRKYEIKLLNNLGLLAAEQVEYTLAITTYEQGLRVAREIGDRRAEGGLLLPNLGESFWKLGAYVKARSYLEQALLISRETGDRGSESTTLSSLSMPLHYMGDDETAQEYSQQALKIAQDAGERRIQAYAWTNLGNALSGLGDLVEAVNAYQQAVSLRREMGMPHMVMESLAGLTQVLLTQGELKKAQLHVDEIMRHLETNTLDGTDEPLRIYLACYQVLTANQDPRAKHTLDHAYHLLQEQAAKITDQELQRSFLENVAAHRDIVDEYSKVYQSPGQ